MNLCKVIWMTPNDITIVYMWLNECLIICDSCYYWQVNIYPARSAMPWLTFFATLSTWFFQDMFLSILMPNKFSFCDLLGSYEFLCFWHGSCFGSLLVALLYTCPGSSPCYCPHTSTLCGLCHDSASHFKHLLP